MIKNAFNKNISIIRLIVIILMLVAVVISGTFAWLTYSSKQTALVLTIGDINDTQIKLSPYQVNGSILPSTTYSSGVSSNIEIYKGNNDRTSFALFYKINQLDLVLINKGLSYTVIDTMGTEDVSDDTVVKNSSFKALLGGNVTVVPDEIMVFDSSIDANITAGMTTNYKIYLWVDSSMGSQQEIQGTSLDMELNASIGSVKLVGDPIGGTTISTVIKDSVVDDTITYTYQWYTSNTSVTTNGEIIEGATEPSIVVSEQYEGKYLYVVVTSSKGRTLSAVTTTYVQNDYDNPVVTIGTLSGTDVSLEYSDDLGVTKYYFGTSDPSYGYGTWTDIESSKSGSINGTLTSAGVYYFAVRDSAGNESVSSFRADRNIVNYYNGSEHVKSYIYCLSDVLCEFSMPDEVFSSTGPDGYEFYGISNAPDDYLNALTTLYINSVDQYYVIYKGSLKATYTKGTGVSTIGATSNSCVNYKTSNGTAYSSTSCSVTLPAITASSGYNVLGWYNSSNTKVGNAGGSLSLSANGTFTARAQLSPYSEPLLNGADPVLASGLIPVSLAAGSDVKTVSLYNQWYDYETKQWANAVLVSDASRSSYYESDGITIKPNQTVPESDILAYFVWIPSYSYKMNGIEQPISISFNNTPSGYIKHPAFNFDGDIPGIWVGKFETSHATLENSGTITLGCINENCSSADGLRIIPHVEPKYYDIVSEQFFASRAMERGGNPFGFVSSEVDTHMMKNSEWGAVAYLSHSVYGINGRMNFNNNLYLTTGCGGGCSTCGEMTTSTCSFPYNTLDSGMMSFTHSTTGNITGVFDMAGGASEVVMAVLSDREGNPRSGYDFFDNSGFDGTVYVNYEYDEETDEEVGYYDEYWSGGVSFPNSKYYDLFEYVYEFDEESYEEVITGMLCNGVSCNGHAYNETFNWYFDDWNSVGEQEYFVGIYDMNPWLVRGGQAQSGRFTTIFNYSAAGGYGGSAFRVVLTVTE